jgi:hypothetical protein
MRENLGPAKRKLLEGGLGIFLNFLTHFRALKRLSHEIDFKNFDQTLKNLI